LESKSFRTVFSVGRKSLIPRGGLICDAMVPSLADQGKKAWILLGLLG
jgi:hypothetical protein